MYIQIHVTYCINLYYVISTAMNIIIHCMINFLIFVAVVAYHPSIAAWSRTVRPGDLHQGLEDMVLQPELPVCSGD